MFRQIDVIFEEIENDEPVTKEEREKLRQILSGQYRRETPSENNSNSTKKKKKRIILGKQ